MKNFLRINNDDIVIERVSNKKFRYHVILTHLPTGIIIEQASDERWGNAERSCKSLLVTKLKKLKKSLL